MDQIAVVQFDLNKCEPVVGNHQFWGKPNKSGIPALFVKPFVVVVVHDSEYERSDKYVKRDVPVGIAVVAGLPAVVHAAINHAPIATVEQLITLYCPHQPHLGNINEHPPLLPPSLPPSQPLSPSPPPLPSTAPFPPLTPLTPLSPTSPHPPRPP